MYVHIQQDKRNSLLPHVEKCVFINYPTGYKGWLFYNPTTCQTHISEHAEFDVILHISVTGLSLLMDIHHGLCQISLLIVSHDL
jgi:hypothetical protein